MPRISFVIPAYNEEKYIGTCLRSIDALRGDASVHEIIVVDNASTDATAKIARSFPGVRVVEEPIKNLSSARQRGLEEASGDLYAAVDADTRVDGAWLATVLRHFEENPRLVCLSGPYSYEGIPRWQDRTLRFLEGLAYLVRRVLGVKERRISGGNAVYRMETLRAIGGFDSRFPFYGEDTNILRTIEPHGEALFDPSLRAYSSGRRIEAEGFFRHLVTSKFSALKTYFLGKPFTERTQHDYR